MPKYFVRQRRAVWICFVQEIEAESAEAAEAEFFNAFDPQHSFAESPLQRVEHGPVAVFDASEYPTAAEAANAD